MAAVEPERQPTPAANAVGPGMPDAPWPSPDQENLSPGDLPYDPYEAGDAERLPPEPGSEPAPE